MRVVAALSLIAALSAAAPAHAQAELETGLAGALRACEAWVLTPSSQALSPAEFAAAAGLAGSMVKADRAEEVQLPPAAYRAGMRYWRIESTPKAGFMLIVSDRLPMCHITGGGEADLQPAAAEVLTSDEFTSRWTAAKIATSSDTVSTTYENKKDPSFSMVVTRAAKAGGPKDRVQVIATAQLKMAE